MLRDSLLDRSRSESTESGRRDGALWLIGDPGVDAGSDDTVASVLLGA